MPSKARMQRPQLQLGVDPAGRPAGDFAFCDALRFTYTEFGEAKVEQNSKGQIDRSGICKYTLSLHHQTFFVYDFHFSPLERPFSSGIFQPAMFDDTGGYPFS